jgi:hypothetical protein
MCFFDMGGPVCFADVHANLVTLIRPDYFWPQLVIRAGTGDLAIPEARKSNGSSD